MPYNSKCKPINLYSNINSTSYSTIQNIYAKKYEQMKTLRLYTSLLCVYLICSAKGCCIDFENKDNRQEGDTRWQEYPFVAIGLVGPKNDSVTISYSRATEVEGINEVIEKRVHLNTIVGMHNSWKTVMTFEEYNCTYYEQPINDYFEGRADYIKICNRTQADVSYFVVPTKANETMDANLLNSRQENITEVFLNDCQLYYILFPDEEPPDDQKQSCTEARKKSYTLQQIYDLYTTNDVYLDRRTEFGRDSVQHGLIKPGECITNNSFIGFTYPHWEK